MGQTTLSTIVERFENLGPWEDPAGLFAQIYVADGVTAQNIANGAAYTKLTAFNTAQGANGAFHGLTPDKVNSKIVITQPGVYLVGFSISADFATANIVRIAVFLDGVEQQMVHTQAKIAVANRWNQAAMGIIVVSAAPKDLDLRSSHDNGAGQDLTPIFLSLSCHAIAV